MKAIFVVILVTFFELSSFATDDFSAQSGVLDLRGWDFTEEPVLTVDGEWLFFWGKHLPADFYKYEIDGELVNMQVPGMWNNVRNDTSYPALGIATYYLKIVLDTPTDKLVLNLKPVATSMNIYVNGLLGASQGRTSETAEMISSVFYHRIAFLDEAKQENGNYVYHLVVHLTNFHFNKGGINEDVKLGKSSVIVRHYFIVLFWGLLISGIILMIFLHHFLLSLFSRNLKRFLFSIIVLIIFVLTLTGEGQLVYYAFPDLRFSLFLKLRYIALFCLAPVLLYYLREMYPKENKDNIILAFTLAYGLNIGFIILFPTELIGKYNFVYIFLLGLTSLYILFYVIGFAVIRNRKGSVNVLISFLIVVISGINDLFYYLNIIESFFISQFGFFMFIIMHQFYLMNEVLLDRKHSLQLAKRLRALNKNLKIKVNERTYALKNQNEALKTQSDEIQSRNRELEALQLYQEKLTHMLIHDLKAPIGTILHLTEVIKSPDEHFVRIVRESTNRMQHLVNNLLDIRRLETAGMHVDIEGLRLSDILNECKMHMQYLAQAKDIYIMIDVKVHYVVYADKNLLIRVINNLLDNAIKHSEMKSEIRLTAEHVTINLAPALRIIVSDDGPGIPTDMQTTIFDAYKSNSRQSEHFRSHGLGLAFCKMAVEAMQGEISIESFPDNGTQVYIDLPRVKLQ